MTTAAPVSQFARIEPPPTWGSWYWPIWLGGLVMAPFLIPEIWALVTGHPENTLSAWVWNALKIHRHESIMQWTAVDFLTFGAWVVLVTWLTFHFFGGDFT